MADVSYVKVNNTTYSLNDVDAESKIANKMNLVSSPTAGNVPVLTAQGGLADSGQPYTPAGIGAMPLIDDAVPRDIPILNATGYLFDSGVDIDHLLPVGTAMPSSGANLNDYTTAGRYHCGANAYASAGSNFPVAKAGYLDVFETPSLTMQIYYTYDATGVYQRYMQDSLFRSWIRIDGYAAAKVSNYDEGVTGTVSAAPSSSQFVRLRVTDPREGGGDYMFYATNNGISLYNMGTSSVVWSSNQTNVCHLQHKTVTGTTNSTSGFISLGLDDSYGLMAVRSADSTYVVLPYYATGSGAWYALVLNNAMSVQKGVSVNLDVDYYKKLV